MSTVSGTRRESGSAISGSDGNREVFFSHKAGRKSLTKLIILILLQSFSLLDYRSIDAHH